jgi:outer membrane receptor for ferrienterochelin and colicins
MERRWNFINEEDEEKDLIIHLETAVSSLDEVVVTGTMKAVTRLESPIAVEVYNPGFFKKNPTPSIFESLQQVNGVRPQLNCNVCNTGDIHINGLEGPYTMITIDGMPIVSSLSSVYGLFGIPHQMIERVEIVKGPASGLYGSEAIGGLINVITRTPEKAPLFSANLMVTNWQEYLLDAGAKYKLSNNLTGLLGINYFNYTNPHDKNGDLFTDVTLQHRFTIFNKWSLQRKFNRQASLAARYFYEDRWGGDMRWNRNFRGGDSLYGESIYTNRWELIGNYQLPVHEKMFFAFSATGHEQNSWYGNTPYMANQKILFGQFTWHKNITGNHELLSGLAGRYNYYDDNSTATIDTLSGINNPERFFIPGIFVQYEWKLNESHQLLSGLRYDHHPIHKNIFTPRFAYKWKMSDQRVFRINAGTGFRVVNLFTEDHAALTGARAVEIKEKLKPESSYNINANFMNEWRGDGISLTLEFSAWYSWFQNQIIPDYETDPRKIIYQNLSGHAISKGISLNAEFSLYNRLKGYTGFTLQELYKTEDKIKQRPLLTEKWSANWSLSYIFPKAALSLDYTGNIYGSMKLPLQGIYDPRKNLSPVWSLQNIQLTKKWNKKFEFYGGIKNLWNWTPAGETAFLIARSHDPFNKQVEYDAAGDVKRTNENPYGLIFDPAYVYAPNQGRRFFLGIRYIIPGS